MSEVIKSISFDQTEIIKNILKLHVPGGVIDCDPTYSKGNFYKSIEPPELKFDKYPQSPNVVESCATNLPLENNSINCLVFDPPFLIAGNRKTTKSKMTNRFSYFKSDLELREFYQKSLLEFHRILKSKGILIFKCQDYTSCGKQYLQHVFIINEAEKLGFRVKDLFVLLAKNRMTGGLWKQQLHARKFHSYFLVLEKC